MKPDTNQLTVITCPEHDKIDGVTGVILAGGISSRMGRNKALLEVDGTPMIIRAYRTLAGLFDEVVVVANSPLDYEFLPCRKVPDVYPGYGSIAGVHSALTHSSSAHTFVTACDMPFLDSAVIRFLCGIRNGGYDAVVPLSEGGLEPLHAVYAAVCKDVFENAIQKGERKIVDILGKMNIRQVKLDEIQRVLGRTKSFLNVNTPEEYEGIRSVR